MFHNAIMVKACIPITSVLQEEIYYNIEEEIEQEIQPTEEQNRAMIEEFIK